MKIKKIFYSGMVICIAAMPLFPFAATGKMVPAISAQSYNDTTFRVFTLADKSFGFDIMIDNKVLIHQPFIPAVQGNQLFMSEKDAEKTAKLMIQKLKKKIMPPAISVNELDSLQIHFTHQ